MQAFDAGRAERLPAVSPLREYRLTNLDPSFADSCTRAVRNWRPSCELSIHREPSYG